MIITFQADSEILYILTSTQFCFEFCPYFPPDITYSIHLPSKDIFEHPLPVGKQCFYTCLCLFCVSHSALTVTLDMLVITLRMIKLFESGDKAPEDLGIIFEGFVLKNPVS